MRRFIALAFIYMPFLFSVPFAGCSCDRTQSIVAPVVTDMEAADAELPSWKKQLMAAHEARKSADEKQFKDAVEHLISQGDKELTELIGELANPELQTTILDVLGEFTAPSPELDKALREIQISTDDPSLAEAAVRGRIKMHGWVVVEEKGKFLVGFPKEPKLLAEDAQQRLYELQIEDGVSYGFGRNSAMPLSLTPLNLKEQLRLAAEVTATNDGAGELKESREIDERGKLGHVATAAYREPAMISQVMAVSLNDDTYTSIMTAPEDSPHAKYARLFVELVHLFDESMVTKDDPNEVVKVIRAIAPRAAAMSVEDAVQLFSAATAPSMSSLDNQSLTLGIAAMPHFATPKPTVDYYVKRKQEYSPFDGITPAGMVEALSQTVKTRGYCTVLAPGNITDVTCSLDGDSARGIVFFRIEKVGEGAVHYSARRIGKRWEITEFAFPVHGLTFSRNNDGFWTAADVDGPIDASQSVNELSVTGRIRVEGKPVTAMLLDATGITYVVCYREKQFPDDGVRAAVNPQDGTFSAKLAAGTYHVTINADAINKRYSDKETSPLTVVVEKGAINVVLDLNPN